MSDWKIFASCRRRKLINRVCQCVCVSVCVSVCVFRFEWKQETKTRRDTFSRHSLWTTKIMSILTHRNFLMDPALGLSFFKSQNFRQRGDSGSNFFLKSFILTSRFQRGVCQAPIVCRFGVMELQSFAKFGLVRHIVSGRQFFCKMKAFRNYVWENLRHSLWMTIFCKMKAVRNYVWENLRHSLWTTSFLQFWHLENFSRFSIKCAPPTHTRTHIYTHTHIHTHSHKEREKEGGFRVEFTGQIIDRTENGSTAMPQQMNGNRHLSKINISTQNSLIQILVHAKISTRWTHL